MSRVKKPAAPSIEPDQDHFGFILNCAVRYAIGRQSYAPSIVVDFVQSLLPYINDKTLYVLDQDITSQKYTGGYGDKVIDEPLWMRLHKNVIAEETKRGLEPYKDWRSAQA